MDVAQSDLIYSTLIDVQEYVTTVSLTEPHPLQTTERSRDKKCLVKH